jgi:hypothetical protein
LTGVLFYRRSRSKLPTKNQPVRKVTEQDEKKALKVACQQHNPQSAKLALLQWGKKQFMADSLAAIVGYCSEPLRNEIALLNQCLYADKSANWDGEALWQAYQANAVKQDIAKQDATLEPLYRL